VLYGRRRGVTSIELVPDAEIDRRRSLRSDRRDVEMNKKLLGARNGVIPPVRGREGASG
jgi:hypothetical protein